jgi:hypothetical protein
MTSNLDLLSAQVIIPQIPGIKNNGGGGMIGPIIPNTTGINNAGGGLTPNTDMGEYFYQKCK